MRLSFHRLAVYAHTPCHASWSGLFASSAVLYWKVARGTDPAPQQLAGKAPSRFSELRGHVVTQVAGASWVWVYWLRPCELKDFESKLCA